MHISTFKSLIILVPFFSLSLNFYNVFVNTFLITDFFKSYFVFTSGKTVNPSGALLFDYLVVFLSSCSEMTLKQLYTYLVTWCV